MGYREQLLFADLGAFNERLSVYLDSDDPYSPQLGEIKA